MCAEHCGFEFCPSQLAVYTALIFTKFWMGCFAYIQMQRTCHANQLSHTRAPATMYNVHRILCCWLPLSHWVSMCITPQNSCTCICIHVCLFCSSYTPSHPTDIYIAIHVFTITSCTLAVLPLYGCRDGL